MMKRSLMKFTPILFAVVALAGCSDSTEPGNSPVGNYTAIQFVTTGTSGQTNQLLIGSSLQINLAANGTTTGHLHLAASGGDPAFDADMAGTWTRNGNVIEFSQAADTFVRDMAFTLQPIAEDVWYLVADQVFSGTRIQLTLSNE